MVTEVILYTTISFMKKTSRLLLEAKLTNYLAYGIALVIILLPFHAFFTTWLGASFGNIDTFRLWKEMLIALLGIGTTLLFILDRQLRRRVFRSFIIQVVLAYGLFSVLRAFFGYSSGNVSTEAVIFGLTINLRYLVFFGIVYAVSQKTNFLRSIWQHLVLIPALIVVGFGLMQQFLLPKDFLEHFGYGAKTIPAYQAVDQKPDYVRLQSTLRGANPLGAYLVFIVSVLSVKFAKLRKWKSGIFLAASLVVLFFTYSRSAWIGLAVSLLAILLILKPRAWKGVLLGALGLSIIVGTVVYSQRNNDLIQNVLFHSDETSQSERSSNEVRFAALSKNAKDIWVDPLGAGVGSAGPASFRNSKQNSRIAENYFIQIGQETGIIGLLLYISILVVVAKGLFVRRRDMLAMVLFSSLLGLSVVNMISHAWADDTLSLLWWGLAGIALSTPVILKGKHYDQKTNTR